ncbi:MAG: hypothetical protein J6Y78_11015 [Paludibacteraceae bacterium]|nr:hypothetical protein [Paludibacteraceae bacterium]
MTKYVVVSDHSGNGDSACIDEVAKVLEDAGNEVVKGGVDSNSESRLRQEGSDTVGVFLVNGACLATFLSMDDMVKGGNCSHVYMGFPKPIMTSSTFANHENWTNEAYKLACVNESWVPSSYRQYDHMWTLQEASDNIEHITCIYGNNCEEVGQLILNGGTESTEDSTQDTGTKSIMSGWESITDLLKPLDGEAMVIVRGDTVLIKRIFLPESTKLWVYEGINVVDNSVKISDYSPEIYNTFLIKWGENFEYEFEISYTRHKELFGERKTEKNAIYEVPVDTETGGDATNTEESDNEDSGGIFGFITDFFTGGESDTNINSDANGVTLNDENLEDGGGSEDQEKIKEIPITDEADAYLFGLKQLGIACRDSGHSVECKVIGNRLFEVGEWCKVYLPSFNEESIMFISKVNHESSSDSEWITSLTLVDYPPSLGKGQSNVPKTESSESLSTGEEGDDTFVGDPSNPSDSETGENTEGENNG